MSKRKAIGLLGIDLVEHHSIREALDDGHEIAVFHISSNKTRSVDRRLAFDVYIANVDVFEKEAECDQVESVKYILSLRAAFIRPAPLIVATSDRNPRSMLMYFRSGADDYIINAMETEEISDRLRGWLSLLPISNEILRKKRAEIISLLSLAAAEGLQL